MSAVGAASAALIEFDQNGKQRLTRTKRERIVLIDRIEKGFPRLPSKATATTPRLENSAVLLLAFLKNRKRKAHDDP